MQEKPQVIHIALIDDEKDFLTLSESFLKKMNGNYNFLSFQSPKEFLKYMQKGFVDIIISDYNMPEMSGLDLIKVVKKNKKIAQKIANIPIILMTSLNASELKKTDFDSRVNFFFNKNTNIKILFEELSYCINELTNKAYIEN